MLSQLERALDTPPRSLGQRDWWILFPWKRNQARCPNPSLVAPPPREVGEGAAAWLSIMVSAMAVGKGRRTEYASRTSTSREKSQSKVERAGALEISDQD